MSAPRSGSRSRFAPRKSRPAGSGRARSRALAPGTDRAAVVAQLEPLARRVQQRLGGPAPYVRIMERHRPVVKPLREHLVGGISTALWILLGTVGIVFLIACANVASLFTVRAENRRHDLAVRRALGAGRGDLVRSQVTEALLLAAAGGAVGALIAWAGVPLLVRAAPDAVAGGFGGAPIPGLATARLDPTRCSSPRASRCWRRARSGCCPRSASRGRVWAASSRPDEASSAAGLCARRAGGRADRGCARPAGGIGAAHAQLLAAQPRRRRVRHERHLHISDRRQPPDLNDRASMSRFQYTFMDRLKAHPGRRIRWLHHHAPAG